MLRGCLEPGGRVAACDRGESPAQRRQREADRPSRKTGRRAATLGLPGPLDRARGSAGAAGSGARPWRLQNAAKSALSWGVGPLGRWRVVRRREVVLDRPASSGRTAPPPRAARRCQVFARIVVYSGRLRSRPRAFPRPFFRWRRSSLPCLRWLHSQTRYRSTSCTITAVPVRRWRRRWL